MQTHKAVKGSMGGWSGYNPLMKLEHQQPVSGLDTDCNNLNNIKNRVINSVSFNSYGVKVFYDTLYVVEPYFLMLRLYSL